MIAFIIGGAECVWDDLVKAEALCVPDMVVCVNDIGIHYPYHIDHWVSFHGNRFTRWVPKREKNGYTPAGKLWTGHIRSKNMPEGIGRCDHRGGSSGMMATVIAAEQGAIFRILCGIPIDPEMGHFHNAGKGKTWKDGNNYKKHWHKMVTQFQGRVKSFSGYTRELLGEPTAQWIEHVRSSDYQGEKEAPELRQEG